MVTPTEIIRPCCGNQGSALFIGQNLWIRSHQANAVNFGTWIVGDQFLTPTPLKERTDPP